MNKILYFLVFILLLGCGYNQKEKFHSSSHKSRYEKLLSIYKEISIDTLKVYSPEDLIGEYKGVEIDSSEVMLFPKEIVEQHFVDPPGLFAIYKFEIDINTIGLITRTPSEYAPSSIKLFFLDKTKDLIIGYVELAESLGDAGDYMITDSWIFKDNDKRLMALVCVMERHDNSVDDEKDTSTQEWNYYYLLNLSKEHIDTISKDEKVLIMKFGNLIKKNVRSPR